MNYPKFFDEYKIEVKDPLSEFLGAFEDGIIEYSYLDAVKLAGHSCPTVASAFSMTKEALKELYKDETAIRGDIKVEFRDEKQSGVIGVMANVVSLICGCSDDGGFKGLNGKFARANLINFFGNIAGVIKFTRIDNNSSVEVSIDLSSFPNVKPNEKQAWQEKVNNILENSNKIVQIKKGE